MFQSLLKRQSNWHLNEFGVDESKITFEIIEEPRRGLFGKLKGEAKVSASYEPTKADIASDYIKQILTKWTLTIRLLPMKLRAALLLK